MSGIKDEPLLITEREAAKMLTISQRKLWQMAKNGEVSFVRLGSSKRYNPADLREMILKKRSPTC